MCLLFKENMCWKICNLKSSAQLIGIQFVYLFRIKEISTLRQYKNIYLLS